MQAIDPIECRVIGPACNVPVIRCAKCQFEAVRRIGEVCAWCAAQAAIERMEETERWDGCD